jgi:hypothetical protein
MGALNLDGTPLEKTYNGGWSTLPSRGRAEFTDLQGLSSEDEVPGGIESLKMRKNRMNALMSTVNELNTAMESFVASVVSEEARERANGSESNEDKNVPLSTNGVN